MNLTPIVTKNKRTSNALLRDISRRSSLNRIYEKKSLELLKKSIEARSKTYDSLSKRDKGGGGLLKNLITGSLLSKRFRGRGGTGGLGSGGIRPKLPKGGGTIGGGVGRFGKFGRIGPLAVLGTGLDFAGRKAGGQTNLQAGIGAGGGLAGALAGGKIGATIGTAILPGVGTVAGGLLGSGIGALAGGNIADTLTGLGSDTRRQLQTTIQKKRADKTLFSGALDKFDGTLKTLETDTAPTLMAFKKFGGSDGEGGLPRTTPKQPFFTAGRIADIVFITLELGLLAASAFTPVPFDDMAAAGVVARRIAKLKIANRTSKFIDFSRTATTITKKAKEAENARIIFKKTLRDRIVSNREVDTAQLTKFFRDTPDLQNFYSNLPGMSRGGRLKLLGDRTLADIFGAKSMVGRDRGIRIADAIAREARDASEIDGIRRALAKIGFSEKDRLQIIEENFRRGMGLEDSFRDVNTVLMRGTKFLFEGPLDPKTGKPLDRSAKRILSNFESFRDFLLEGIDSGFIGPADVPDIQKFLRKTVLTTKDLKGKNTIRELSEGPITDENFFKILKELGEIYGDTPVKKFAEGGRVEAGTPYIVGEIGEELFVPDVSGDIIPNDQLGPAVIVAVSEPDTITKTTSGGGSSGGGRVIVPASPFDVVAKYAQMTGLFTV